MLLPAATILPSDCTATALILLSAELTPEVTLPSPPNDRSSEPAACDARSSRHTAKAYSRVVLSSAVTSTVMALAPTSTEMAALGDPPVTVASAVPSMPAFTAAPLWLAAGVSWIWVTSFATTAVYCVVAASKAGSSPSVPVKVEPSVEVAPVSPLRAASEDCA